jgi:hypothetical protein
VSVNVPEDTSLHGIRFERVPNPSEADTDDHVPRKILVIHQYRPDGDGLKNPYDAGQAEIADKRNLQFDPRVDVVVHVDSVCGDVWELMWRW